MGLRWCQPLSLLLSFSLPLCLSLLLSLVIPVRLVLWHSLSASFFGLSLSLLPSLLGCLLSSSPSASLGREVEMRPHEQNITWLQTEITNVFSICFKKATDKQL